MNKVLNFTIILTVLSLAMSWGIEIDSVIYKTDPQHTSGTYAALLKDVDEDIDDIIFNGFSLFEDTLIPVAYWYKFITVNDTEKLLVVNPRIKNNPKIELIVKTQKGSVRNVYTHSRIPLMIHGITMHGNSGQGIAVISGIINDGTNNGLKLLINGAEILEVKLFPGGRENQHLLYFTKTDEPLVERNLFELAIDGGKTFFFHSNANEVNLIWGENNRTIQENIQSIKCPLHKIPGGLRKVREMVQDSHDTQYEMRLCHNDFWDGIIVYSGLADTLLYNPVYLPYMNKPGNIRGKQYIYHVYGVISQVNQSGLFSKTSAVIPTYSSKIYNETGWFTLKELENLVLLSYIGGNSEIILKNTDKKGNPLTADRIQVGQTVTTNLSSLLKVMSGSIPVDNLVKVTRPKLALTKSIIRFDKKIFVYFYTSKAYARQYLTFVVPGLQKVMAIEPLWGNFNCEILDQSNSKVNIELGPIAEDNGYIFQVSYE